MKNPSRPVFSLLLSEEEKMKFSVGGKIIFVRFRISGNG
jgi:hypothetical protein